ncbi:MAG: hypothetical protein IJD10_01830 [Clostridia bacterium]|nr:hypothetical protein [Clostridia bacterium]
MYAYRNFLKKMTHIVLTAVALLSAAAGIATYPVIAVLGSGFREEGTVTTLAVMLAGLCLARLIFFLWDKDAPPSFSFLLLLGILSSLAVLPLRKWAPFSWDGYFFPLLTGLFIPRLLLGGAALRRERKGLDLVLTWISGICLLALCLFTAYGALRAFDLTGTLNVRVAALPLLWFAPLFERYAKRIGIGSPFLSASLWLLPFFPAIGIFVKEVFVFFLPAAVAVAGAFLLAATDQRRSSHRKEIPLAEDLLG